MSDEVKQLILVALIIIVIFLIVLLIVKLKSKKDYATKKIKNKYLDRKIKKYAKDKDFLFLTNVFLPVDSTSIIMIDNLIIGNKYIYVIAQKHWQGYLKGYEYDTKWLLTTKNKTSYVDNPLIGNRFKVQTLLKFLNESDDENIVNIIAINDKSRFESIKAQPLENVTRATNIFKIIDEYENTSPLNDIKEEEAERIANLINEESTRLAKEQKR